MSLRPRGMFSAVLLVGLAAVSAGIFFQARAWLYRLPAVETADREGLMRWMVLADLEGEPEDVSRRLLARFEELFDEPDSLAGGESDLDLAGLSASQINQLRPNVAHMKTVWFRSAAEEYDEIAAAARPAFLDRQIRMVFLWAEVDWQLDAAVHDPASGEMSDRGYYLGAFFDSVDRWQAEADEGQRPGMAAVVKAGFLRWLATYDLAEQPMMVRRRIVAGLERQLGGKLRFSATTDNLPEVEAKRFWANVELLAEAWFTAKAVAHAKLPKEERSRAIAGHLAVIRQLAAHWPAAAGSSQNDVMGRVQRWIAAAPAEDRPAVSQFASELAAAYLLGL